MAEFIKIREICSSYIDRLVSINGILRQIGKKQAYRIATHFKCLLCGKILRVPYSKGKRMTSTKCVCKNKTTFSKPEFTYGYRVTLILEELLDNKDNFSIGVKRQQIEVLAADEVLERIGKEPKLGDVLNVQGTMKYASQIGSMVPTIGKFLIEATSLSVI